MARLAYAQTLVGRVAVLMLASLYIVIGYGVVFPTIACADDCPHDWGEWVLTKAPSYVDDGEETSTCRLDPSHTRTREVPALGPSIADRAMALRGAGNYGEGIAVRLIYTRPYVLDYQSEEGVTRKLYQSVPIGLDNCVLRGNDLAIRYTGDAPTLAMMYMGKSTNLWKGWTSKNPTTTVTLTDGSGQKIALYSWAELEDKWQTSLNDWKNEQIATNGVLPDFDSMCLTVGSGKRCQLVEIVALGGEERVTPEMRPTNASVSAKELVDSICAGYNFGGHMESHWESADGPAKDGGWGRSDLELEAHWSRGVYITRQAIKDLKARGFNAIRLPITWSQHIYAQDGNPYHIDDAWMARVHEVVDWCLAENLYVIVNTHHETWLERADMGTAYEEISPELKAVWTQIANEFCGYDQRLIFEGMNEPHSIGGSGFGTPTAAEISTVELLNEDFVATIRGIGSADPESRHLDRILMVVPYCGSGDAVADSFVEFLESTLLTNKYPSSDKVVVSAHSYAPHSFTHFADEETLEDAMALWPNNVYTEAYRDNQDRSFMRLRRNYTNRNIPVILGEFGSYYCGEERQPDRLAWMTTHVTHLKELGIPGFIWGMDRSYSTTNVKVWNVYDEDLNVWSAQSSVLIDQWFNILNDSSIQYGGMAHISPDEHQALADGMPLVDASKAPYELDYPNRVDSNSYRVSITPQSDSGLLAWTSANRDKGAVAAAIADDKEIAVQFTGDVPYLWLCSVNDAGWKNWTKLEPREVIDGVGYWPCDSLRRLWCDRADETSTQTPKAKRTLEQLTCVYVATNGITTVADVRLLGVHTHVWGEWTVSEEPTCTTTGERTRVCMLDASHRQTDSMAVLGHDWATPTYAWSNDYATCTATRACERCPAEESEVAIATHEVLQSATTTGHGSVRHTATFAHPNYVPQQTTVLTPMITELALQVTSIHQGESIVPQVTWSRPDAVNARIEYKALDETDDAYTEQVPTTAGIYVARATADATDDYEAAQVTTEFFIIADEVLAFASGYTGTYDGLSHGIVVCAPDGASVQYRDDTGGMPADKTTGWVFQNPSFANVGTYVVSYKVEYEELQAMTGSCEVHINPAPLVVKACNVALTYGDEPHADGVTYKGFVGGEDQNSVTVFDGDIGYQYQGYVAGDAVGTYADAIVPAGTQAQTTDALNYELSFEPGAIVVGPKSVGIAWPEERNPAYTGLEQCMVATVDGALGVDDGLVSFVYGAHLATDVGSYEANVTGLTGERADNYVLLEQTLVAQGSCAWEIVRANNSVQMSMADWTYGQDVSEPTVVADFGEDALTIEYSTSAGGPFSSDVPQDAGAYYARAVVEDTSNYEGAVSDAVPFVIKQAAPQVGPVGPDGVANSTDASAVRLISSNATQSGTLSLQVATLTCGTHTYGWLFVPEDPNYHTVSGTVEITCDAHAWGAPKYVWSEDLGKVTASRTCANDASHTQSETATATRAQLVAPTVLTPGSMRVQATFENPAFATQTREVAVPALPSSDGGANQGSGQGTGEGVGKAVNGLNVKARAAGEVLLSKVQKKARTVALPAQVDGAQGLVTYAKVSGDKNLFVNARTGKITVKKGTKKGAHKVTIRVTATGDDNHLPASNDVTVTVKVVKKLTNPMRVTGKTALSKAGKGVVALKVSKVKGKLSYKKVGGSKQLAVNARTGKVTVRKGAKKGTYKVRVKVIAAGNTSYKKATKTVTCTITVV